MLEFTVLIAPCACPRPRVRRFGGVYYPAKYQQHKDAARKLIEQMHVKPIGGNLILFIDFYMSVPKSYSKKERAACLGGSGRYPGGDIDNYCKSAMDFLTAAGVWGDDNQVIKLSASKQYAEEDKIVIRITAAQS